MWGDIVSNWKAGDKAVRVEAAQAIDVHGLVTPNGKANVIGNVYLVGGVDSHDGMEALLIAGYPVLDETGADWGWPAWKYRKVVPMCDHVPLVATITIGDADEQ